MATKKAMVQIITEGNNRVTLVFPGDIKLKKGSREVPAAQVAAILGQKRADVTGQQADCLPESIEQAERTWLCPR